MGDGFLWQRNVVANEEVTRKRREERRAFKLERARLEREKIEEQLREERRLAREQAAKAQSETRLGENVQANDADSGLEHVFPWQSQSSEDVAKENGHLVSPQQAPEPANVTSPPDIYEKPHLDPATKPSVATQEPTAEDGDKTIEQAEPGIDVNQEHLQLTLEEAFFLSYGLGVLAIHPSLSPYPDLTPSPTSPISTPNFFTLCRTHSNFPPAAISALQPDDPFLLHYAVYHHYRSLGWVVRPGIKFSVDYLLYNRGPVFSHAEFAVMIVPEYSAQSAKEGVKDWWWLHCINRVQSQVRKSLVVCYVEVPDSLDDVAAGDVGAVFKKYRIREFVIRRWLANRSRD
ncbi:tRNA splicing endonuclease subunit sen2 [Taxawa tesnikishii (nom. ined.)]|nr:tRNA splicing endonuclease subunit sen2 [Dothideales sp. JES 119]